MTNVLLCQLSMEVTVVPSLLLLYVQPAEQPGGCQSGH